MSKGRANAWFEILVPVTIAALILVVGIVVAEHDRRVAKEHRYESAVWEGDVAAIRALLPKHEYAIMPAISICSIGLHHRRHGS